MTDSYRIRTFAIHLPTPTEGQRFIHAMKEFRDLENYYSRELAKKIEAGLAPETFESKGRSASNGMVNTLKLNLTQFPPDKSVRFSSRAKRSAAYYPYFAVRNALIRAASLGKIFNYFLTGDDHHLLSFKTFLRTGKIGEDIQLKIRELLSVDIFRKRQDMSAGFLQNSLGRLRNDLLARLEEKKGVSLKDLEKHLHNKDFHQAIDRSFTKTRHGKEEIVPFNELPEFFLRIFTRSMKARSTRLYNSLDRRTNSRGALLKRLKAVPWLTEIVKTWAGDTLKSFQNHFSEKLLETLHRPAISELEHCTEQAKRELLLQVREMHLKSIVQPRFSSF